MLNVFPGSERLRYTIPFASPEETIDHLRRLSEQQPGAVCLFGDDGEKFGTWPETKKHVYEDGWLARFFDALVANQCWLQDHDAFGGDRKRAAGGQDLSARLQLPRNDRMGIADRAVGRIRADYATRCTTTPGWRRCSGSCAAASGGTSR